MDIMAMLTKLLTKNGLIFAFVIIGITNFIAYKFAGLSKGRIHGSAVAIFFGLILAYIGGGAKGLASIPLFAGVGLMGGAMFRDFAIVSTAFGADLREIKKVGVIGVLSLVMGLVISWVAGVIVAYAFGYRDTISIITIAAGVCTFVVGPVTGAAVGSCSEVFAIGYDYNGTILSEVASGADHVYLSDPTTIVTKFTDIATIMGKANAGTDAVLTDNIGAKFVMTDAQGNKYTSEKFDITEAGKTFSFNIKINEDDITEDGWYPTNADFELTYTDPKGTTKTIKSTKNPEVYWVAKRYDYKIEYYYDGQIDNTLIETGKDVKGKEITVSDESIKNNAKEGYSFVNTEISPDCSVFLKLYF